MIHSSWKEEEKEGHFRVPIFSYPLSTHSLVHFFSFIHLDCHHTHTRSSESVCSSEQRCGWRKKKAERIWTIRSQKERKMNKQTKTCQWSHTHTSFKIKQIRPDSDDERCVKNTCNTNFKKELIKVTVCSKYFNNKIRI